MLNTLLLITGAGASHDVVDTQKVQVNPHYQPPLTKDLFGSQGRNSFTSYVEDCLKQHPVAAQVGYSFKINTETNGETGLEKYLSELRDSTYVLKRNQYWTTLPYLRQLFYEISHKYLPTQNGLPSNYKELIDIVATSGCKELLWLNLNYDLFGDYAIRASTFCELEDLSEYTNLETPDGFVIRYAKPHGSVDWFRQINDLRIDTEVIRSGEFPEDFQQAGLSQTIVTQRQAVRKKLEGKYEDRAYLSMFPNGWFPALLAPVGKYSCVFQPHIDSIIERLPDVDSLLCIGFNALDADIISIVSKTAKLTKLRIVNGEYKSGGIVYNRLCHFLHNIRVGEADAVFDGGFTNFVKTDLKGWLRRKPAEVKF